MSKWVILLAIFYSYISKDESKSFLQLLELLSDCTLKVIHMLENWQRLVA